MSAGQEPDGPIGGRPAWREGGLGWRALPWRGLGCVGALVLCVVLASAGMAGGGPAIREGARIEVGHDPAATGLPHAAAAAGQAVAPRLRAAAAMPPRPRPRAQSIDAGGLPPPRAPTA
ncbi:MAG: hypothetical protein KF830_18240 [Planctomycetes bacterium]|nr:hypothetical protein [Planctomycetota bacterium]